MTAVENYSPLAQQLNRLAGITDILEYQDEQGAANVWANTSGLGVLAALNQQVDETRSPAQYKGLNDVCNELAGTTGLEAIPALSTINPAEYLLTNKAAYYIDSTAPQNWGSLGYVQLNGINDFLSTPDASALDVTGDIDIRVKVSRSTWISASSSEILLSKFGTSDGQVSYAFSILGTGSGADAGKLRFFSTPTGLLAAAISNTSSEAINFQSDEIKWLRATLDVDNGASGRDYKFFTSDDGTTWTQLGTTLTSAGTTSIFNSTAQVEIGSRSGGQILLEGKVYQAQIFASTDGTDKRLDVDIATDYESTDFNTFFASTGQPITVNGNIAAAVRNLGNAGSLLPTQVGSATTADSNDPKFLDHTGTNYVYLPGVSGNRLTVPDEAALDITGDIDIRVQVALDNWIPAATTAILAKRGAGNNAYSVLVGTTGLLVFIWSEDGTNLKQSTSTIATGITNGTSKWIRATLDVDNGASGNDVKFFLSDDGITWTQLGTTVTTAGVTSIYAGTTAVEIGARTATSDPATGKFYRAQILDGIDGTTVLDVDTSVITTGAATSFTAVTGQTVTINRSTSGRKTVAVTQPCWLFGTDDYMEVNNRYLTHTGSNYLYLPGINGNWASTPDAAVLDITGDIDIRCKVALDDWTPGTANSIITKRTSNQIAYGLEIKTTGELLFNWSTDGTAVSDATSSVATGVADGDTKWVRATLDVDNGNSENEVKFYLSDNGTDWTQLGTTITTAGTTSIFSSTALLGVGARQQGNGNTPARGKFFRAQVLDGIDGTVVFDANFETSITSLLQTTFTESSVNAATVTINRNSAGAFQSAGITEAGYLYPGATNTFTASATNHLDFGATDSFTALIVSRQPSYSLGQILLAKTDSLNAPGYVIRNSSTTAALPIAQIWSTDGTSISIVGPTRTNGVLTTSTYVRNTTADNVVLYTNSTTGTASSDVTTASLSSILPLRIGRFSGGGTSYADMELYAAAVFRKPLTAREVKVISDYFTTKVGA